jgi:hypothetical protein
MGVTIITYEVDRTVVTVEVPSNAPVLAWSEATVRKGNTTLDVSTSITVPRTVIATIPKDALSPGNWDIQVRAGATEPHAQTVYDGKITVRDSI